MLGFARMLRAGLEQADQQVEELWPRPVWGKLGKFLPKTGKWFAYADKYLIFPKTLRRHLRKISPDITHLCDHSNSVYLPHIGQRPHLVTCHDVMAIRSARGHFPQVQVGLLGRKLQIRIFRNLKQTDHVACDSENSRQDLVDLAPCLANKSNVVHLGFNQPMKRMNETEATGAIRSLGLVPQIPFLLHVGNDAWYKNRSGLLGIFSSFRKRFGNTVKLVLVGPSLNEKQREFAKQEGFIDEIVQLAQVSEELLRALYSTALALIFPSLYEGFGWPPLEAQACGCPVIASPLGSLSEILEKGGILIDPENHEEYAETINRLREDIEFRDQEIKRGSTNATRFDAKKTVSEYLSVYKQAVARKDTVR